MEIVKGYDIHPDNYNKKTPVWLKKIADGLLASILVIDPLLMTMPDNEHKEWIMFSWNIFVALFKLISKTVTEKV
jgi:hypothetical protein